MTPRICVITAGHLATCPRMLKAADAFFDAGYRVRVISTRHVAWATAADAALRTTRTWASATIDYNRASNRRTYLRTGLRARTAQLVARALGAERCPLALATRAYSRVHTELVRAALAEPADLFYGGTTGALAAVATAGRRARVPFALDLEDFHSAEQDDSPSARLAHGLAERIERDILCAAAFLTTSSDPIGAAYADKYGVRPLTVHNTFSLPAAPPDLMPSPGDGLQLYWFSQTIGPQRGLEDAVRAMGHAAIPGALHLRGRAIESYVGGLQQLARAVAPQLQIILHEPAAPDAMIDCCRGYDVGLALEQGTVVNHALCLANKAFTYMLGGLAVAFTDTVGQRPLAQDLGEGALLYTPGDGNALARGLAYWARNKPALARAKQAAWEAARRRWYWEHPTERGALLAAVACVLGPRL